MRHDDTIRILGNLTINIVKIFDYLKDSIDEKLHAIDKTMMNLSVQLYQDVKERHNVVEGNCEDRVEKIFEALSQQRIFVEGRSGALGKQVTYK